MNVTQPEKFKIGKKNLIIYISIIIICIISIIGASYIQFYARIDFKDLLGLSSTKGTNKTEDKIEELKERI